MQVIKISIKYNNKLFLFIDCMQIAQDFKCPYDLLSCKGNEEGECKCKDG